MEKIDLNELDDETENKSNTTMSDEQGRKKNAKKVIKSDANRPGIGRRANPNLGKNDGCTPLWIASSRGNWQCMKHLIKYGAQLNKTDTSQVNAFCYEFLLSADQSTLTVFVLFFLLLSVNLVLHCFIREQHRYLWLVRMVKKKQWMYY